ncbi:secondary thiamine-phosphate synthase enzyme YjbQ [Prochlorococcus sp. MIT 1223]|uniref:secondary thiamine-phosphate synthase enzyme YjbQ n=1 Tax=Prochlorococcus sp. MIT 1223 TaxID=3096217 RepID=UPI002A74804D|nr:secondary thiamine-phosphate synthase enzyme YjbQ [Prochlorococcus sp. MIT 1223]
MKQFFSEINFKTYKEGFTNITPTVEDWIDKNKLNKAILVISTKHTSCSLIINENADPNVLKDLSNYMRAIVPEDTFMSINGDKKPQRYLHYEEGPDDMPAHIRTMLTSSNISMSINEGKLVLGTWQAIYLWEHRHQGSTRKLNFHSIGEIS